MRKVPRKRIDWAAVHAKLAAHAAAPATAAINRDRADRLLTERTRALAAGRGAASRATHRLLVMRVGAERYALAMTAVREAIEIERVSPLPGTRPTISGLVNWRGEFAIVCNLAAVVGAEQASVPRRAVVLSDTDPPAAIAVDAVEEIVAIDVAGLQPAGELSPKRRSLFRGATADAVLVFDETALIECLRNEIRGGIPAAA